MKKLILLFVIFIFTNYLFGQSINNVQFPASTKWKQIETEYFILIFPEGLEEQCKEFAALIDSCVQPDSYSLKTKPKKWPILINNTISDSNGYVAAAPEHSQLYTMPIKSSFMGAADWMPILWTHELRHILQNDKTKRGFTAFAGWIFGQYGTSILSHFALPSWIWEGDAVLTETLLTSAGRGRLAEFERGLRTNTLNGKRYGYAKSSLGPYGSYKTRVQSWYVMGYHICSYLRKEYGIDKFNKIIEIAADFSFVPLILNIAVENVTGKSIKEIYKDCMDDLNELWVDQLENRTFSNADILLSADKKLCSDYYPLGVFSNGDVAVLRTSLSNIPTLMRIDQSGGLTSLRKISPSDSGISFNGEVFCWAETTTDLRWGNVSWSRVRVFNTKTGEFKLITEKSRYFYTSISPNGKMIAAIDFSKDLKTSIVVLDSNTGEVLRKFKLPKEYTAMQTCWSNDSTIIYIRQGNWQKSLRGINLDTEEDFAITEPSTVNIKKPYAKDGKVYYVSEESGLENIHVADIITGENNLLVSRAYAAVNPIVDENKLIFADYSVDGFSILTADLQELEREKNDLQKIKEFKHVDFFSGLEEQEKYAGYLAPDKEKNKSLKIDYEIKDYSKAAGVFNFHSRFLGIPASGDGITLDFYADSILNNISSRVYVGYDFVKEGVVTGFQSFWSGWYPVIIYGAEFEMPIENFGKSYHSYLYSGLRLPFNLSSGIYNQVLNIQSIFYLSSNFVSEVYHIPLLRTSISWSLFEKQAKRDIFPNFGIGMLAGWNYGLNDAYFNFLYVETDYYLPGILENNGIHLNIDLEYNFENAQYYYYPKNIPRGLLNKNFAFPFLINTGIDYIFPLAYPDLDIINILYLSRISVNAFFDAAFGNNAVSAIFSSDTYVMMSTGLEFFFDFNLFNSTLPLRGGVRMLYNFTNDNFRIEDPLSLLGFDF